MIDTRTIINAIPHAIKTVDLPGHTKHSGKVRDSYLVGDKRIIITTDRQSAFDKILGYIPFKGQVLTQLSAFWFVETSDILPNHIISLPDPNVMVVKNAKVIPIEMVVRGYITGVTDTSLWGAYEKGERTIYGIKFPEDLQKNQRLEEAVITPTTKAEVGHDEKLTEKEILERNIVSVDIWKQMKKAALELFKRGQEIADKAGMTLVDTKYEMGLLDDKLILVDEVHTPDSSRYWVRETYEQKLSYGEEPESYDKEPLRIWFKEHGYKGEGVPPVMPPEFIAQMSMLYMSIYEKITGKEFSPDLSNNPAERIINNIQEFLHDNA